MISTHKSVAQFIRFLFIGILNTAIDLAVLNALVLIFGVGSNGEWYVVFKSISFLAAVTNSYFCNRYWVFRSAQARTVSTLSSFFAVSVMGFVLNVAVASATFNSLIGMYPGHTALMANLGAVMGTCAVLAWNFLGYKFFVFKA